MAKTVFGYRLFERSIDGQITEISRCGTIGSAVLATAEAICDLAFEGGKRGDKGLQLCAHILELCGKCSGSGKVLRRRQMFASNCGCSGERRERLVDTVTMGHVRKAIGHYLQGIDAGPAKALRVTEYCSDCKTDHTPGLCEAG